MKHTFKRQSSNRLFQSKGNAGKHLVHILFRQTPKYLSVKYLMFERQPISDLFANILTVIFFSLILRTQFLYKDEKVQS